MAAGPGGLFGCIHAQSSVRRVVRVLHSCDGVGVIAPGSGNEQLVDEISEFSPTCRLPAGLVLPVRLDPEGRTGPTRGQAQGPRWVSVGSGRHRSADAPAVVEQRILDEAVRLGSRGAVTGWAALRMRGAAFFDGLGRGGAVLPVPVRTPDRHLRADPGLDVIRGDAGRRTDVIAGVRVASPEQALLDHVRSEPDDRELVVALDMAFAARTTSRRRVKEFLATRSRARGVARLRHALDLAHELSRSPGEPRLRLVWVLDAGRPLPLCNRPIFDLDGKHLGTPDLFDPEAGVVGEYNGSIHRRSAAARRDAERDDHFRRHGLETCAVVGSDVHDVARVVERIDATYARALWRSGPDRTWTLTPPPGWPGEVSVDEELDHRDLLRALSRED